MVLKIERKNTNQYLGGLRIEDQDTCIQSPQTPLAVLSIRAGPQPEQPATGQSLAGYFRLILLLILVRNLK